MRFGRRLGGALLVWSLLLVAAGCGGTNVGGRRDSSVLAALRADDASGLVPPEATVADKGALEACGGGSRSDGWAELTWSFSTGVGSEAVRAFYRSELLQRGWAEGDGHAYGESVLIFQKAERQLRLYVSWSGQRHLAILEAPPKKAC